jgi:20S proteasome alpha/beta subunit
MISAYGLPRTIEKYLGIGSGEKYARVILKKVWDENMPMEQVLHCLASFHLK